MAAARTLDRKARWAVAAVVAVFLAGPLLAIRSFVASAGADEPIVASNADDDELVTVGGHTMLLHQGSTARKIVDWIKIKSSDTRSFQVSDRSFAPNSAEPTPDGWTHLAQLALIMKANSALTAQILVPVHAAHPAILRLEQMRAGRLRDELIRQGVPNERVTARASSDAMPSLSAKQPPTSPQLVVILSR
jgi:hypothetical protein